MQVLNDIESVIITDTGVHSIAGIDYWYGPSLTIAKLLTIGVNSAGLLAFVIFYFGHMCFN